MLPECQNDISDRKTTQQNAPLRPQKVNLSSSFAAGIGLAYVI